MRVDMKLKAVEARKVAELQRQSKYAKKIQAVYRSHNSRKQQTQSDGAYNNGDSLDNSGNGGDDLPQSPFRNMLISVLHRRLSESASASATAPVVYAHNSTVHTPNGANAPVHTARTDTSSGLDRGRGVVGLLRQMSFKFQDTPSIRSSAPSSPDAAAAAGGLKRSRSEVIHSARSHEGFGFGFASSPKAQANANYTPVFRAGSGTGIGTDTGLQASRPALGAGGSSSSLVPHTRHAMKASPSQVKRNEEDSAVKLQSFSRMIR
jgi:hypothetical protein